MSRQTLANTAIILAVVLVVGGVMFVRGQRDAASRPAASRPGLPRLVDFGGEKCATCKEMAPMLRALAQEYAGRAVVEVIDVFARPSAMDEFGVRVVPTQVLYDRDGKEVWRHEGGLTKAEIVAKFAELGVR